MTMKMLPFKDAEWKEVIRAYEEDVGEWSALRMCDVFAFVNSEFVGSSKIQAAIQSYLSSWLFKESAVYTQNCSQTS